MRYKEKKVIGITGGIGSGKTKVLSILKDKYDALIIDADKVVHELQCPGENIYYDIVNEFGPDILETPCIAGKSAIDRKKLGNIVFADNNKLNKLNEITHPAVHNRIANIIADSPNRFIFVEAALLTETSLIELTDEIWYIYSDIEVRLDRLRHYRDIPQKKALQIMANQPDDSHFRQKCDKIIDNSGDVKDTLTQIEILLNTDSDKI